MLADLSVWNASPIEMVWTAIGLVGIYTGWQNLRYSKRDLDAIVGLNGNNLQHASEMRLLANGHYRNDLFRLAKLICILTLGLTAMLLPPTNAGPGASKVTPTGILVSGVLLAIAMLVVMASILDRRQREQESEIEEEE